ncbi:MAG: glycosyl hydrolase family 2 [Candidatus Marinimicrobia bacterium]|nr:glycosyl hydrolase family 2 [Candidatus Neomarinimicrobiota bacterium]
MTAALFLSFCGKTQKIELTLPALFNDNMVLQQQADVPVWGSVSAGEIITVTASWGESADAKADAEGIWRVKIRTPMAGGPYDVTITGQEKTIVFQNVMIGEVWVCSGQSNMEMPLKGWPPNDLIEHSDDEIAMADYANLRLFTVSKVISDKPLTDCKGNWSLCTPEIAGDFSATAFFFGKKLLNELKVPVGLIHTSWGGTPAEAWTPGDELRQLPDFFEKVEQLKTAAGQIEKLNRWLGQLEKINMTGKSYPEVWKTLSDTRAGADYDDSRWKTIELPVRWEESKIGEFDGIVWFRKEVKCEEKNGDYILELGPIDDMDITYFNGTKIGGYEEEGFWQTRRIYTIPEKLIKKEKNVIAVCVVDNRGGGGIWGRADDLKLYPEKKINKSIPLAGPWKFSPIAEFHNDQFYIYGEGKKSYESRPAVDVPLNSNAPTVLFNGMIHPVIPYGIKGAIWYQGESNVGRAEQYKKLFPLMIQSWRKYWKQGDFPFYFVQIAPYEYGQPDLSQYLREAQLSALSLTNTGVVVTTDIGNPQNIHPAKKLEVGERLAGWALNKDYGFSALIPSGPLYKSMKVEDNKIRIFFEYADPGLICSGKELTDFLIADVNKKFVPAKAKIDDNSILVWSDTVTEPIAVRFGWTNIAEPNLFNGVGLPASPFRTDNWK